MKVQVINEFRDKHLEIVHSIGDVFECTEERFEEIKEAGDFVKPVKEETKEEAKKEIPETKEKPAPSEPVKKDQKVRNKKKGE